MVDHRRFADGMERVDQIGDAGVLELGPAGPAQRRHQDVGAVGADEALGLVRAPLPAEPNRYGTL